MTPRCWCCQSLLATNGRCPICDMAGLVSPPHVCLRRGEVITDEHACEPEWPALATDHERGLVNQEGDAA